MLSVLRDYAIKGEVKTDDAWKWKCQSQDDVEYGDGDEDDGEDGMTRKMSISCSQTHSGSMMIIGSSRESQSRSQEHPMAMIPMQPDNDRSPFRIGRVISVVVDPISREHGDDEDESEVSLYVQRLQCAFSSSMLPSTVRRIRFGLPFHHRLLALTLPDHITHINIMGFDETFKTDGTAAAASALSMNEWKLPSSLRSLRLSHSYVKKWSRSLSQLSLPATLTELHLGTWNGRTDQLPTLPPNLQTLHMGDKFNSPLDSLAWPASLTSLTLSFEFNHPLELVRLPDSLTYLHLGRDYTHPIERMHLPASLTHLDMFGGWKFNQPLGQITLVSTEQCKCKA